MSSERFTGTVEGGKVHLDHGPRWEAAKARLDGKRIELSIGVYVPVRSSKANRRLWSKAVYAAIANWCGHTKDEVHAFLKEMFCPLKPLLLPTGEEVIVRSTRLLNNVEFSEYMMECEAWGAQNGVEFPDPEHRGTL